MKGCRTRVARRQGLGSRCEKRTQCGRDAGMVEYVAKHGPSRYPRRDKNCGNPHAEARKVMNVVGRTALVCVHLATDPAREPPDDAHVRRIVWIDGRRRYDVVVQSTVLVVGDDQERPTEQIWIAE